MEAFFKCYYLEIPIHDILDNIIEKFKNTFEKLHGAFKNSVWKIFLNKFIANYFQTLILSCARLSIFIF